MVICGKNTNFNTMKFKLQWLLYLLPILVLIFSIGEIFDSINHPEQYPFGGEMFAEISIYSSSTTYILYHVLVCVMMLLIVISSAMKWKKVF